MKRTLLLLPLALTLASPARADYNPIVLTPGSFTADVVVEKAAPQHALNTTTTATMDGGTGNTLNTWYEHGRSMPGNGLPVHGSTFTCVSNATHQFTMPPDYTTKDALLFYSPVPTATLTLSAPAAFLKLSVLNAGGGASTVNYTVHHQGGGTEAGTLSIPDWNDTTSPNVAWFAMGRINKDTGVFGSQSATPTGPPRLFYSDLTLTDQVNPVTSIDFASTSANRGVVFGLAGQTSAGGSFSPIAVTGFNYDMIVEANALLVGTDVQLTSVTMTEGIYNYGTTFYEIGFDRDSGYTGTGLPNAGSNLVSGNYTWTMAPNYRANDVLFVSASNTNGTLTLATPRTFTGLSLLDSAGNGPVPVTVTVHHADATTEVFAISCLDWYLSTQDPSAVYSAAGRFGVDSSTYAFDHEGNTSRTWVYKNDLTLANTASAVTSVDVAYAGTATGTGNVFVFALAGQTTVGGSFSPVTVTGYNQDGICEASSPVIPTGKLYLATTISMDAGTTNTGNTWYEQGYNAANPTTGLPPAGSTITSASLPDHHYQMPASYAANNAIYIDSSHPTANLTIASPAAYSALSFLSATANGWVSNACIMQYADGTKETNYFVSQNWFNNSPYAFDANGRITLDTVTFDSVNSGNPRLYEAQFALGNTGSPVTNVVLQFLSAQQSNGRMVVMAASATVGGVPPIFGTQPTGVTTFEGSNVGLTASIAGGTTPITLQWYAGTNGVWSLLSDSANITGTTTASLSLVNLGWTNTADYELVAHNSAGSVTSAVATVTVLSTLSDVALPGDPIVNQVGYCDSMPHAIDHTTSKYLTSGQSGVLQAPFVGPVSFVLTPSLGQTIVSALRFYTADDSTERDPMDYLLEGSNDGGATYAAIASGALNLPLTRNAAGQSLNPLVQAIQEVHFANATGYAAYRMTFNNVRNDTIANSMQIGEIEFLGVQSPFGPIITNEPVANLKVFVGASPTVSVAAYGYPANLIYQWYRNGTTLIPGATSSSYTLPSVQSADAGNSFSCVVANTAGATNSSSALLLAVVPRPTQAYPVAVLADNPVGFWRLDEGPDDGMGNNGVVAYDAWGSHNGSYNNTLLAVQGYNPTLDPDTAAQFGYWSYADCYAGGIQGVSFAAPTNQNAAFSVEAWVMGTQAQNGGAGVVVAGPGHNEQFALECGGTGSALRFYFRDASSASHAVSGTFSPNDGLWHHVVAVLDEVHTNESLYVDGLLTASANLAPGLGVWTGSPLSIGARQSTATTDYDLQFVGSIDEVAVYGTALSTNQILAHYYAGGPAPLLTLQPTNTSVPEGTSAVFYSQAYGPGVLGYQWYQSTDYGYSFTPLTSMTSPNLTLASVSAALDQSQYQVVVTTAYGTATSSAATLTVSSGPPVILPGGDLPAASLVYAGRTLTLSVAVGGTAPFTYVWQHDGVTVVDSARISGSHTNLLTITDAQLGDAGNYQVFISNASGGPVASALDALTVEAGVGFNGNGLGWSLNGSPSIYNNAMALTTGGIGDDRGAFYEYPLYIGAFSATFTYQDTSGPSGADGVAFVVQNDPRGAAALGGGGGNMGFGGIQPSVALQFNIFSLAAGGVGIGLSTNGLAAPPYQSVNGNGGVGLDSGDPINVTILYSQGTMRLTLYDQSTSGTFSTDLTVNVPDVVGADTAFVGITGSSGGVVATQVVSDFDFIPYPALWVQVTGTNTLLLTWPASIGGYVVQSTSDLGAGTWQTLSAPINEVNGQNQTIIPVSGSNQFYRLTIP